MNTAIIGMAQGIGFAVPSNTARWVVSQLLTQGRVRRGMLGLAAQQLLLSRQLARFHHLENRFCVAVVALEEGGPADSAGIREGDLIVTINGHAAESVDLVHRILAEYPLGQALHLVFIRGKELMETEVVPAEAAQ